MVLVIETGAQERHRGQMEEPRGEHRENHREAKGNAGGFHPVVRLVLRQVQDRAAVPLERTKAESVVQAATLQLGQVGHESGSVGAGSPGQRPDRRDQLFIADVVE